MRLSLPVCLLLASCASLPLPSPDDDDGFVPVDDDDSAPSGDDDVADDDDDDGPDDPGPPDVPDTIDILSISVLTGPGEFHGTDANQLSVCLSETDCFRLNVPNVDDFRVGEMDVHHVEGVGLPRSAVDRVEIRSAEGSDRWTPACLELRFDGEPVYCAPVTQPFGNEGGAEVEQWRDPDGLHQACTTCWDGSLTHGPMVGAVTDSTARILLRADATRRVVVHAGPAGDGIVGAEPKVIVYPSAASDFVAEVILDDLLPATEYVYFVEIDGRPEGAFHTFETAPPAGAPSRLDLAFGSCSKNAEQPVFTAIADEDPDLFLFVGDNHYGNTPNLDAHRWNYRWMLERPPRAALVANTSTLATWDDHDFVGNNTDGLDDGKEVALRAFDEYWANPSVGLPQTAGVFFKTSWGDVDLFFVDDRYWRGFDDSILGAPQTQWLRDELAASTATFKLLVCGSQWTADGSGDSWASFLPARDALFDFVRDERIDGVVLLSGDVHRSELRTIDRSAAGGYDLPELTSSPLANSNSTCPNDAELTACFDTDDYYVSVSIDTTATDPWLQARIVDAVGIERASTTVLRSELTTP